ncbi:MAG: hypothetical protein M3Y09_16745 [Actinomycetota bacterium]|nr:hypothetical protein [Actinomycetota bacterium]
MIASDLLPYKMFGLPPASPNNGPLVVTGPLSESTGKRCAAQQHNVTPFGSLSPQ